MTNCGVCELRAPHNNTLRIMTAIQPELPAFEPLEDFSKCLDILVPALLLLGHGSSFPAQKNRLNSCPDGLYGRFDVIGPLQRVMG